ncbi:MAG: SCO family protein [Myxococcales bacterium]|nr:SCO family protein [Myxococcales bacterium]
MRPDSPMPPPEARGGWLYRAFIRRPWHFAAIALLLVITGLRPFMRRVPDPPPVMLQLPEFSLVDQDGQAFTNASLKGKVTVAGFIFTSCPSTCPKISRAMLELQQRYVRNGVDVELVSFTVDPENDTPAVLQRYADNLGADQTRWRFVTGPLADVEKLIVGGFKTAIERGRKPPPGSDPVTMYDIAHSEQLVLIDEHGGVRGFYAVRRNPDVPREPLPMGVHASPEAEALGLDVLSLDELYHRSTHVLREQRQPGGCAR